MTRQQSFWWGAFGSILPEILRFFKIAAAGEALPQLNWILYTVLLTLFVVSSGFFSIAWKPENEFKAIWVGCSVPALVATLVQAAPVLPHGHG
jgi:CDP-diglyceride synthetase